MNRLIIEVVLVGLVLSSGAGLYYMIKKNGELSNENENLVASVEDTQNAILNLGNTITGLQTKYNKAGNDEFDKFKKTDINKVSMAEFVRGYNVISKRVLKDYHDKATEFTNVDTKAATP